VTVPDPIFAESRLANIYDPLDPDRSDLEPYLALAEKFGARSVLDIGCGTGTFACLLARRGLSVTAVDPAAACVDIARSKPGAEQVGWFVGDAPSLPPLQTDLVTMTANVAQVFLTDDAWNATLDVIRRVIAPGGHLVFETRDPAKRAWHDWTRQKSHRRVEIAEVGAVETWVEILDVDGPYVSFRHTFVFHQDGTTLTSDSKLVFRNRAEISGSLLAAGFTIDDLRDAPDRPGRELVFIASPARR
jgi:SAM-dependent methyltransferase